MFKYLTGNYLVFNTNWEDPDIDRKLLKIDKKSDILTISSAGTNLLEYLLDNPNYICSFDINPAQHALSQLKAALFKNKEYHLIRELFIKGRSVDCKSILSNKITMHLDRRSKNFWNRHYSYFNPHGTGFYYKGTSGFIAFVIKKLLNLSPRRKKLIQKIFEAESVSSQLIYYNELKDYLWSLKTRFLSSVPLISNFLGIPAPQLRIITDQFGSPVEYLKYTFGKMIENQLMNSNYFWQVYYYGKYEYQLPKYLKDENTELISENINRVSLKNDDLYSFLKHSRKKFSHIVLLDHLDWFYDNPHDLEQKWKLILSHAKQDAKILFRSASKNRHFHPSFINDHIDFKDDLADKTHFKDKVGTYAKLNFGIVKNEFTG